MIVDFTRLLKEGIPVYPGTLEPRFEQANTIEKDGFAEINMTMCTHTGTHIDAPAHIIKGSKTLNQFNVAKFIGQAVIFNCREMKEISLPFLKSRYDLIKDLNFILFYTGWQQKWNSDDYLENFPTITEEACKWLQTFSNLNGLGFDAISVDKADAHDLPNHHILLASEILIIENMTNIDQNFETVFELNCIPLLIENSDGSPVRAFGRFDI